MRKRISSRKFGKLSAHRKAMMSNLASSLIEHKRIKTTHQKALEIRKFIEPMVTKAKDHTVHNRREVLKKIHNHDAVKTLFDEIAPSYSDRPGGYTRIIKLNNRLGDNAEMAMIELVDFNELLTKDQVKKKKTRRRGGKKTASTAPVSSPVPIEDASWSKSTGLSNSLNEPSGNFTFNIDYLSFLISGTGS